MRAPDHGKIAPWRFVIVGREAESADFAEIRSRFISPGYLETVGVRLIAGRDIAASDVAGTTPVGLINRAAAERYRADLSYMGTYAADRQLKLESLLIEPARRLPEKIRATPGGACARCSAVASWTPKPPSASPPSLGPRSSSAAGCSTAS